MLRQRNIPPTPKTSKTSKTSKTTDVEPSHPTPAASMHASPPIRRQQDHLLPSSHPPPPSYDGRDNPGPVVNGTTMRANTQWLALAVASGACAAFNGVFAKLTTTELTTSWASSISSLLGLSPQNRLVEILTRATFFGLNLLFNGIMWALFTSALTRATSTTRVSIINTSSNFMLTALLGFLIFAEALPPLWWLGASLLVVGNVIIGRRDEEGDKSGGSGSGSGSVDGGDVDVEDGKERDGVDVVLLGEDEEFELEDDTKGGVDVDDPVPGPSFSYR